FGALLREGRVEMPDEQQFDPEPRDLALLDPKRGQPIGLAARHEDAARMRLEGQHPGRLAGGMGALAGGPDQRGVTEMQPVKIAHRQYRAARMGGSGTGMANDAEHGERDGLRLWSSGGAKIAGAAARG